MRESEEKKEKKRKRKRYKKDARIKRMAERKMTER